MAFAKPSVVIDNGSYWLKAGFSCDNHPVSMFRNIVGRPKGLQGKYGRSGYYEVLIGDEAAEKLEEIDLDPPVVNGRIVQWDNMERIWYNVFYKELKVAPEDRAVMLAVSPRTPISEKLRCSQVFFEALNVPALCIQSSAQLPLFGSGYTTGMSIDLGYDSTDVCPVYEGGPINYAHLTTGYAGRQVADYIRTSFNDRQLKLGQKHVEDLVEYMIRNSMYVTDNSAAPANYKDYERTCRVPGLTSGRTIEVTQEAFMASEMFFQPELVLSTKSSHNIRLKMEGKVKSLPDTIYESVSRLDEDLRNDIYKVVVICGGLSSIPGLGERLQMELRKLSKRPWTVLSSSESSTLTWMGAAAYAGIEDSQVAFVTKKDYEEFGVKVVKNKFL